jgi:hypothetical protein
VQQVVDGETIILNPMNGKSVCLNGMASGIWPLLKSEQSADSIVQFLLRTMDAPPADQVTQDVTMDAPPADQVTQDVKAFLEELHKNGIIEVVSNDGP